MIIILDTSVIISFFLTRRESNALTLLKSARRWDFRLAYSPEIFAELIRKIQSPKIKKYPNFCQKKASRFIAWYKYNAEEYFPDELESLSIRDRNDQMFLNLAKACNADYIISQDRDLLTLWSIFDTKIVNPETFVKLEIIS